jgi:hypothetical protein
VPIPAQPVGEPEEVRAVGAHRLLEILASLADVRLLFPG